MSTPSRDIANELPAENEREKTEERSRKIRVTPSKLPRLDWFDTLGRVGPTVYLVEEESGLVVAEFCASQRGREDAAGIVLRNNAHDALVKALLMARPIVDDIANGRKTVTRKQDAEYIVKTIDAALAAAQE